MSRAITIHDKVSDGEYSGLFNVITDYVYALDTLDRYDFQSLQIDKTTSEEPFHATYENAMEAINALKVKFGGSQWFANEKDDSFKSSIGQIYQSFGGEDLYPSVEEKAAMLLYLVVKKLHAKMGDRLNIVSISVDKQRKDWERAMEDEKMPWQQALVPQTSMKALVDAYFVRYIPSLVVIDPDGNIQLYTNDPSEAHRYLEEKLN